MLLAPDPALAPLQRDWTFHGTSAPWQVRLSRLNHRLRHRVPAPAQEVLVPATGSPRAWTIYFVYLPDGRLDPAHLFTMDRLRALGRPLLIVCAAPSPRSIPEAVVRAADALVWKDLPGFDFSAYGAGLRALAAGAPGSDALVLNDSVFGPVGDLSAWLEAMRWDLSGFTATSNVENHIQSYAFHLRAVTPQRVAALASVMPRAHAYDRFWAVVFQQETRFARVAARSMTVGSLLYVDTDGLLDPPLALGPRLLGAGFPFLKRSLLGKLAHLHPREEVEAALRDAGYPL